MATTTNYSWTTPDDTALVKDGASAIRALGTAIDTSMNTALGTKKAGMVLLNTTSFTTQSSVSINDVFSATYTNYRVVTNFLGSASTTTRMRLRVSGADNTTSNYYSQGITASPSSGTFPGEGPVTTGYLLGNHTTRSLTFMFDFGNPFASAPTTFFGFHNFDATLELKSGTFDATTSFTGFTLIPASGTITGSVSVYGYNL